MRKVHELRARGITIVFVSHAVADVKAIGDRVLWLEHGRAMGIGETDTVLPAYLAAMAQKEGKAELQMPFVPTTAEVPATTALFDPQRGSSPW